MRRPHAAQVVIEPVVLGAVVDEAYGDKNAKHALSKIRIKFHPVLSPSIVIPTLAAGQGNHIRG
jgi:hypothetical protein